MKYAILILGIITLAPAAVVAKDQTNKALEIAKKWQDKNTNPIMGDDGRIRFVFGESQPHIVCAPLTICDVAMEQGEVISTVKSGDTSRWVIEPARVGSGDNVTEHIIIKPKAAGLRTTVFIGTDRRSYLLELFSAEEEFMGKVGFLYHDGNANQSGSAMGEIKMLPAVAKNEPIIDIRPTMPAGHEVLASKLNFNYQLVGHTVPWRPVRVYDDGVKTFIDLDKHKVRSSELPTLLISDTLKVGTMINYRYVDGRYIVDGLFKKAKLIMGKGFGQKKVSITRGGTKKSSYGG